MSTSGAPRLHNSQMQPLKTSIENRVQGQAAPEVSRSKVQSGFGTIASTKEFMSDTAATRPDFLSQQRKATAVAALHDW